MKGISIIIPVYNREKYIAEAIQSVISQNFKGNLEIIISDDGSTDKTLEIARSFGDKVKILTSKQMDHGAARARNRGLHFATQPYIAFLDSDDFYLPNHLNRMTHVLEDDPEIDFAFCRTLQVKNINGEDLYKPWTKTKITKKDTMNLYLSGGNIVNTNCFIFRRHIFKDIGGFDEKFTNGEDMDMWNRISEKYKGAFVDYYGAVYRIEDRKDQLTSVPGVHRHYSSRLVNQAAIDRYYQLDLNNSYRIYKLKIRRSNLKNKKVIHYINCVFLSCRYPVAFIQTIPSLLQRFFRNKKLDSWEELSLFLSDKKSLGNNE